MPSFINKIFSFTSGKIKEDIPEKQVQEKIVVQPPKSIIEEINELHIPFGRVLTSYQSDSNNFYFNENKQTIVIELDNGYLFNNNTPTITNNYFNPPVLLNIGLDKIETTKVRRVLVTINISKQYDGYEFAINSSIKIDRSFHSVLYGAKTTMTLSELLENDVSKNTHSYEISAHFRSSRWYPNRNGISGISCLNNFLQDIKVPIEELVVSNFKTEVDSLRNYVNKRKNRIQFEEELNIDKVKECFIELFDYDSIEINQTKGSDYYYNIYIPNCKSHEWSVFNSSLSLNLNDKMTEILFHITEGASRIKGIYDCCIVNMNFNKNRITIQIKEKKNEVVINQGFYVGKNDNYESNVEYYN
jgi:hypothetical protein